MRKVYLYAFDDLLNVVNTKFLIDDAITVRNMLRVGNLMRDYYPESLTVYAVDNRPGLYKEFMEAVKGDFTAKVEFADTVTREGIRVG